jgi:hypothetical protein
LTIASSGTSGNSLVLLSLSSVFSISTTMA